MKKIIVAAALALFATTASATIAGSSHDLNSATTTSMTGGTGGAACAYCHMPHNGSSLAGAPLWARRLPSATATTTTYAATYSFYSSVVGGRTPPANAQSMGAGSRACLSCHDGVAAVAVVFNPFGTGTQDISTGKSGITMVGSIAKIGTDLSNDHPVSVLYTAAGGGYAGLTAQASVPAAFSLPGNQVECISCHNAHNEPGASSSYSVRQFMVTYTGDFCAACHSLK